MLLKIPKISTENPIAFKWGLIAALRRKIINYPMGVNEIELDEYFRDKYKKGLKTICIDIVSHLVFSRSTAEKLNFVATINRRDLDKLAQLITYGNSEVQGSSILRSLEVKN